MNDHAELAPGAAARTLLSLRFSARAESLKTVRRSVRAALDGGGCADDVVGDVVIAIDEACQNIIRHAYGGDSEQDIHLTVLLEDGTLVVRIEDHAETVDAAKIAPRNLDDLRPGGLGTYFMREIMDSVAFDKRDSGRGNILTMRKQIG